MEIKATLQKPYTEEQKIDFIVEQNHKNSYELRETDEALQAWGYTEEEKQEQEKTVISKLSLTKREVLLALFDDKGVTPDDIKSKLDNRSLIEFEYAEAYYRGNSLIDVIGESLGYSSEDLDYLFRYGHFNTDKAGEENDRVV